MTPRLINYSIPQTPLTLQVTVQQACLGSGPNMIRRSTSLPKHGFEGIRQRRNPTNPSMRYSSQ